MEGGRFKKMKNNPITKEYKKYTLKDSIHIQKIRKTLIKANNERNTLVINFTLLNKIWHPESERIEAGIKIIKYERPFKDMESKFIGRKFSNI